MNASKFQKGKEQDSVSILVPRINLDNTETNNVNSTETDYKKEDDRENNPKRGLSGKRRNRFLDKISSFNIRSEISKIGMKLRKDKSKDSDKPKKTGKKYWRYALIVLLILVIIASVIGLLLYRVYQSGLEVKVASEKLVAAVKEEDLDRLKTELGSTRDELNDFEKTYDSVLWMKPVPYFGKFISDGEHAIKAGSYGIEAAEIGISAVEPYADIIGFKSGSEESKSGEETAQDRLDFVVKTIPDLVPKSDELAEKLALVREEVDQINPERYPEEIQGRKLKETLKKGIDALDQVEELVDSGRPLLKQAPYILGVDDERTYLVIFQNDKELRPTGGFITAYSIAKVEKGKFEPVASSDIYSLDNGYTPRIVAPDPIIKYLKGPYTLSNKLRLRDMNWSPDYKDSMKLFSEEIERAGIDDIDGIIAVDTQVLVNILDVIGPIGVSGFGNFSTEVVPECNCPQVIYELESFADIEGPVVWSQDEPDKIIYAPPNYDNRKKIIGPLMNSILSNSLGQPKEKIAPLFEAGFKSLLEKHVLFYMYDEESQTAVEEFGVAGKIKDYQGDYLYINDANLGGRKSNLYVTQEVVQQINISADGMVEKTVSITYKNPEKHDGWLNSVLPNWVRIYVPKGSELLSLDGLEEKVDPYDEFDKTVFAGYFQLRPQGVAKVDIKYKLPMKFDGEYSLLLQKQAGKDKPLYVIELGKKREELFLKTDEEFKFKI